jgi:hypothetical protein
MLCVQDTGVLRLMANAGGAVLRPTGAAPQGTSAMPYIVEVWEEGLVVLDRSCASVWCSFPQTVQDHR